jgi:hypothetical protein
MLSACWKLLASVPPLIGASEAVQIELLRLLTAVVGAVAAIIGAFLAYRANVRIGRQTGEMRRKRRRVRDADREQVLILDEPADSKPPAE